VLLRKKSTREANKLHHSLFIPPASADLRTGHFLASFAIGGVLIPGMALAMLVLCLHGSTAMRSTANLLLLQFFTTAIAQKSYGRDAD
jgi:hypothetical protein